MDMVVKLLQNQFVEIAERKEEDYLVHCSIKIVAFGVYLFMEKLTSV
jgi:hypothetical protein